MSSHILKLYARGQQGHVQRIFRIHEIRLLWMEIIVVEWPTGINRKYFVRPVHEKVQNALLQMQQELYSVQQTHDMLEEPKLFRDAPFDNWLRLNKQAGYSGHILSPDSTPVIKHRQLTMDGKDYIVTILKMSLLLIHDRPIHPNYKSMMPGLSSPCARDILIDSHEFSPHTPGNVSKTTIISPSEYALRLDPLLWSIPVQHICYTLRFVVFSSVMCNR